MEQSKPTGDVGDADQAETSLEDEKPQLQNLPTDVPVDSAEIQASSEAGIIDESESEQPPQQPPSEQAEMRSRDSISLQRVASVEEISRAMAKAEKSRPRRKRQESETMQNWKKDFEERLKKKDELEAQAIEQLRLQADNEKQEWYDQWKQGVAERREQNLREQEEASDQVDDDVWVKMSRLARSLNTRKNSQDLNRMRAFLNSLDRPPRNNGIALQTR